MSDTKNTDGTETPEPVGNAPVAPTPDAPSNDDAAGETAITFEDGDASIDASGIGGDATGE